MSKDRDKERKIDIEVKNGESSGENPETEKTPSTAEAGGGEEAKAEENEESQAQASKAAESGETGVKEKGTEEIVAEYEAKLTEQNDRFLRLAAEFDNYKKRSARQYEDLVRYSSEKIIVPMLEVLDNFERALEAASKSSDYKALLSGAELIYQQFFDILKKEGVEPIEAVGKEFDPGLHEAVMQAESEEYPEGVVVQEVLKGYRLHDKVIRFARVVVSKGRGGDEKKE